MLSRLAADEGAHMHQNKVRLDVAKQRNGPTGYFHLLFDKPVQRFRDLEEGPAAARTQEPPPGVGEYEPEDYDVPPAGDGDIPFSVSALPRLAPAEASVRGPSLGRQMISSGFTGLILAPLASVSGAEGPRYRGNDAWGREEILLSALANARYNECRLTRDRSCMGKDRP